MPDWISQYHSPSAAPPQLAPNSSSDSDVLELLEDQQGSRKPHLKPHLRPSRANLKHQNSLLLIMPERTPPGKVVVQQQLPIKMAYSPESKQQQPLTLMNLRQLLAMLQVCAMLNSVSMHLPKSQPTASSQCYSPSSTKAWDLCCYWYACTAQTDKKSCILYHCCTHAGEVPVSLPEKLPTNRYIIELEPTGDGADDLTGDAGAVRRMLL